MQPNPFKQSPSPPCNSSKIYFPSQVFGKPTKNRQQDPNMFQLLSWGADGFQKHAFKRDQKFKEATQAYMNMIGKSPWMSESRENYVDYHGCCIDANTDVLGRIENYIQERLPESGKEKKEQQKRRKSEKKVPEKKLAQQPDRKESKKENKNHVNNYLSPKAERKTIQTEPLQQKLNRYSSGEVQKLTRSSAEKSPKKLKIKQDPKYDSYHKQMKSYGLEKTRQEQHDFTQSEQQKLIEQFKQTTRWIPNSAFTTYFGKPPFENYGRGNTHPVDGGLVYGTYLYSHNVHPHRGRNQPKNIQSYPTALAKAKSQGTLIPTFPRTKAQFIQEKICTSGSKIEPEVNSVGGLEIEAPCLGEMEKFGGKRRMRVVTESPGRN